MITSIKQIEFVLNFDHSNWTCSNTDTCFIGSSLEEIDNKLQSYIDTKFSTKTVKVKMHFDFDRFPAWMRQYMAHYFNRELIFKPNN